VRPSVGGGGGIDCYRYCWVKGLQEIAAGWRNSAWNGEEVEVEAEKFARVDTARKVPREKRKQSGHGCRAVRRGGDHVASLQRRVPF
jgi:hypothetical protein